MQRVGTAAGVIVALVFIAVSAAMNYTFLSSLGRTPLESQLFGAVSLAADAAKALLPLVAVIALRSGRRLLAAAACATFVLFTVASFLSALGFTAVNRISVANAAETRIARQSALKAEIDALRLRREALPAHRPTAVVAELLAASRQDRRWASSKQCTDATETQSRQFCDAYYRLRAEHATGLEADKLEEQRRALATQLATQATFDTTDPDPQARVVAAALGIDRSVVQRVLVMLLAVIIEIGSGLGLYFALSAQPERTPRATRPTALEPTTDHGPLATAPSEAATKTASISPEPEQPLQRDPEIMRAILRRPVG